MPNEKPLFGEQAVDTINDSLGEHSVLRYLPEQASGHWEPSQVQPGQRFQKPAPLFKKLDPILARSSSTMLISSFLKSGAGF